jgi:hypothetical protein
VPSRRLLFRQATICRINLDADSSAANNPGLNNPHGAASEGIVADPAGHLYAAENSLPSLTKCAKQ